MKFDLNVLTVTFGVITFLLGAAFSAWVGVFRIEWISDKTDLAGLTNQEKRMIDKLAKAGVSAIINYQVLYPETHKLISRENKLYKGLLTPKYYPKASLNHVDFIVGGISKEDEKKLDEEWGNGAAATKLDHNQFEEYLWLKKAEQGQTSTIELKEEIRREIVKLQSRVTILENTLLSHDEANNKG